MHFIFTSLIDFIGYKNCYRYGILDPAYEMLKDTYNFPLNILWRSCEKMGKSIIVTDIMKWGENKSTIDVEKIDEQTVCVFSNIKELMNNCNCNLDHILNYSVYFKIDEITISDNLTIKDDYILCYSKDKNMLKLLRNYAFSKRLYFQNILLKVTALSDYDSRLKKMEYMFEHYKSSQQNSNM